MPPRRNTQLAAVPKHETGPLVRMLLSIDSWMNELTGIGTAGADKTTWGRFFGRRNSDQYLEALFEGDPLARKICEKVPDEMLRAGWVITAGKDADTKVIAAIQDEAKRLCFNTLAKEALTWERCLGGAALWMDVDDGTADPALPLAEDRVQVFNRLRVLEKTELHPATYYPAEDVRAGDVETWWVEPQDQLAGFRVRVHETRLITFRGSIVSKRRRLELDGWGGSVLDACHDVLRDFNMSWGGLTHMLQSANQEVWYFKNLVNSMKQGSASALEYFNQRLRMSMMQMGPNRAIKLDADGEKFERHSSQFTGIPETLEQVALRMAAVADMPVTLLFGQSPSGMNATGESDLRNWNDACASKQTEKLEPVLRRFLTVVMLAQQGPAKGKVLENWGIKFNSLRQLSELEKADLRNKQMQTDKGYEEMGVVLPEEIALSRFGADGYSTETTIDLEVREEVLELELERMEEEAINPPPPPPNPFQPGGADPNAPPPKPGDVSPTPSAPPKPAPGDDAPADNQDDNTED